jgi:hypothetical protein
MSGEAVRVLQCSARAASRAVGESGRVMIGRKAGRGLLALAVGAATAVSGCGDEGSPAGGGAPEGAGLSGTVRAVSDVEGLPELTQGGGWVVAVPLEAVDGLWTEEGVAELPDRELPHLWTPLSRTAVEAAGGSVAQVDGDGRFRLEAGPGERLVCLLVEAAGTEQTRGCRRVDLPESGELRLKTGEGGLQATLSR